MECSKEIVYLLLDSDVVIHLIKAERIALLNELYPGRIKILDIVLHELYKNDITRAKIDFLHKLNQIIIEEFPLEYLNEFKEYKRINGDGEKACLIYCKHKKNIIASSNTKDIVPYCNEHNIAYMTTLDFFAVAINRKIITKEEANEFIKKITYKNSSYLCCNSIEEHLSRHFDPTKYLY